MAWQSFSSEKRIQCVMPYNKEYKLQCLVSNIFLINKNNNSYRTTPFSFLSIFFISSYQNALHYAFYV